MKYAWFLLLLGCGGETYSCLDKDDYCFQEFGGTEPQPQPTPSSTLTPEGDKICLNTGEGTNQEGNYWGKGCGNKVFLQIPHFHKMLLSEIKSIEIEYEGEVPYINIQLDLDCRMDEDDWEETKNRRRVLTFPATHPFNFDLFPKACIVNGRSGDHGSMRVCKEDKKECNRKNAGFFLSLGHLENNSKKKSCIKKVKINNREITFKR